MFKFNFDKEGKVFNLLKSGNKITYEFAVLLEEKDVFFNWIKILSSPEFLVDVDLARIQTKNFIEGIDRKDMVLFRVHTSGKEEDLKRWQDNLKRISKFLNGNYEITYIKERSKSDAD